MRVSTCAEQGSGRVASPGVGDETLYATPLLWAHLTLQLPFGSWNTLSNLSGLNIDLHPGTDAKAKQACVRKYLATMSQGCCTSEDLCV